MRRTTQSGFTLIEIIVSLGVFSVVITIAVGALLMLVAANDQLQSEQAVMTNLSFALDSMTREIRTGTNYYCDSTSNRQSTSMFSDGVSLDALLTNDQTQVELTRDCASGRNNAEDQWHGMAFEEGGESITGDFSTTRILYYHDAGTGQLYRRVGSENAVSIVASDIFIHDAEFVVTGSEPLSDANETEQASVTIYIEASRASDESGKKYFLQTTVTQRTLDI